MRGKYLITLLILISIFPSMPSSAALNDELYPAIPPAGSAYIRVLNGSSTSAVPVKINNKAYNQASRGNISAYAPVPHGNVEVTVGDESTQANVKEGHFYTAVMAQNRLFVAEEPENENRMRAQVVLINGSKSPEVSLKTKDGFTYIVNPVASGRIGAQDVNPVKVPLAVYAGSKKIHDISAHSLQRGTRYAVIVYDGDDGNPAVSFD